MDEEKHEKVKDSIRERYKILADTPMGYAAKMGDVVTANMRGYELNEDGTKGTHVGATTLAHTYDYP